MPLPLEEQNIIKILGIESLPDERKLALLEKITDLVQKRLLLRILDSLTTERQEEFKRLLDTAKEQEINAFLREQVPQFPGWVEEETTKVKQELASFLEEDVGSENS